MSKRLDEYFPYCGPCCICGGPDARHRIWDSITGMSATGDSAENIAEEFDLPVKAVQLVLQRCDRK
jgi:hypothetical protein